MNKAEDGDGDDDDNDDDDDDDASIAVVVVVGPDGCKLGAGMKPTSQRITT